MVCDFHLVDYMTKYCLIKQPEYMMCNYSPELTEQAIPDDPRIKVFNRFVT